MQPKIAYFETEAHPATIQAIPKPIEQITEKKILYSTSKISTPTSKIKLLKLNQLNQKATIAEF
jgi:hypothetical protein